jgi:two-component system invasion response regulator UvrY
MNSVERHRVSVLLVDGHAVVREGYRCLLERGGNVAVVGEANDSATAYSSFCRLDPQIVVMYISLPWASGIDAMRRMLAYRARARVLMFSMHADAIFPLRAMRAGAFGYVFKACAPEILVEAVHSVATGQKYLSADIAQKLALHEFTASRADEISARELKILSLLAQGCSTEQIAKSLGINSKTVANHRSAIKAETRRRNRF